MLLTVAAAFVLLVPVARSAPIHWTPAKVRAAVYRTDPCLAHIVDHEDGTWDPTRSFGGGHNVNGSYGLGQANPGWKMAPYGKDWRTNPFTQLRWAKAYANGRYGSTCAAWAFWQTHLWW